jgi:hypothetical protein
MNAKRRGLETIKIAVRRKRAPTKQEKQRIVGEKVLIKRIRAAARTLSKKELPRFLGELAAAHSVGLTRLGLRELIEVMEVS